MADLSEKELADIRARLESELELRSSPILRAILVVLGTVCVALGAIGVVLPVMPTTPFLLLAAFCYARSSKRFYLWLMTNPWFGTYLRDWREGKGISLRSKIVAILMIIGSIGSSVVFIVPILAVKIALVFVAIGICAYLISLPNKRV